MERATRREIVRKLQENQGLSARKAKAIVHNAMRKKKQGK